MFFDKIHKKTPKTPKTTKNTKKHQKQSLRCPGVFAGHRRTDCTLGVVAQRTAKESSSAIKVRQQSRPGPDVLLAVLAGRGYGKLRSSAGMDWA